MTHVSYVVRMGRAIDQRDRAGETPRMQGKYGITPMRKDTGRWRKGNYERGVLIGAMEKSKYTARGNRPNNV